jgi:hypothetical protein
MVENAQRLLKEKLYEPALEAFMGICENGGAQRVG